MKNNTHLLTLVLFLVAACLVFVPTSAAIAASSDKPQSTASELHSCKQKISKLNYRSALLGIYKKSENKKHQALHKKWAPRISYAGQWVPKYAENTRDSLYEYDELHAISEKEINKQIQDYKYLSKTPLVCTKNNLSTVTKKLEELQGIKNKKVVGGQALISQNKKKETEFLKKDFKKSSDKMVKKLHKEKSKHPKPQHPRLDVKF